jgi:hypothetical protein
VDLRIRRPQSSHQARVGVLDGLRITLPDVDIIGTEHELDDVGLGVANPAGDVVADNVVNLVARVALVLGLKAGGFCAVGLYVGHGADEVDVAGEVGGHELGPDLRAPASDFGDGVAEEHCGANISGSSCGSVVVYLLTLTLAEAVATRAAVRPNLRSCMVFDLWIVKVPTLEFCNLHWQLAELKLSTCADPS